MYINLKNQMLGELIINNNNNNVTLFLLTTVQLYSWTKKSQGRAG